MVRAESAAASARDIYRCHRSFEKAVAIDGGNNKLFVDGVQQNWYNGGWQITSAPDAALLLACGRVRRRKEETK